MRTPGDTEGGLMSADLPTRPSIEHLKNQAKALLRAYRENDPEAVARFRSLPQPRGATRGATRGVAPKLADAQRLVALQYGFASWPKLKAHVSASPPPNPVELVKAAFEADDVE